MLLKRRKAPFCETKKRLFHIFSLRLTAKEFDVWERWIHNSHLLLTSLVWTFRFSLSQQMNLSPHNSHLCSGSFYCVVHRIRTKFEMIFFGQSTGVRKGLLIWCLLMLLRSHGSLEQWKDGACFVRISSVERGARCVHICGMDWSAGFVHTAFACHVNWVATPGSTLIQVMG